MTQIGGNATLAGVTQAGASIATGGSSLAVQLGVQGAVLIGTTLLSRAFDRRAVLSRQKRIADPASVRWDQDPVARHPTGDWVIDGGTIMAAFHKTNRDGSKASTRCDVVIALAPYDIPEPTLRLPIIPNQGDPSQIVVDGFVCFINGQRVILSKERERLANGNKRTGSITEAGITYAVRDHYEPLRTPQVNDPYRGHFSNQHLGAMRIYLNQASDPDHVRWQELRAYLRTEPSWWDRDSDKDGTYTESEYYNGWGPNHQLKDITGLHVILNYSSGGIAGNRFNNEEKKKTQVTGFPSLSFEYQTGQSGNPADVLEYAVQNMWGFPAEILDAPAQARARTRCNDYRSNLTGSGGTIRLKPMRVAGVLTEDESPLRILQMLETISGGQVAFHENKISLVPGEFKTDTPTTRHLTEKDLRRAPEVVTNIANNQRRNAVQGTLEVCLQSRQNNPVNLPLVGNQHLRAEDNNQFVERVSRISYVNDWFDAQQLMAMHNELQGTRQRVVLPVWDTDETRSWREGTDIVLSMSSLGIEGVTFIIDEVELELDEGLVVSAYRQGTEDPFEFLSYSAFDQDPDDGVLVNIETGDILVPQVSNLRRPPRLADSNIDAIVFDVARIDQDYGYYLETQYKTPSQDWQLLDIRAKNELTYRFESIEFNNKTVRLRMRYRTGSTSSDGLFGDWTEEFVSAPVLDDVPDMSGLAVVSITRTEALAVWYPAEYLGHQKTELRLGKGKTPGQSVVGNVIEIEGDYVSDYPLTGLEEDTDYWLQGRFVNVNDQADGWGGDGIATAGFRTLAAVERVDCVFKEGSIPTSLVKGEAIDAVSDPFVLPVAYKGEDQIPTANATYSVESGLPNGMAFDAANRHVTGTPGVGGNHSLLYKVLDDRDNTVCYTRLEFFIAEAAALETQYIYRRHNNNATPPKLVQTATDRDNDNHVPSGWDEDQADQLPTSSHRYQWRASRSRLQSDSRWSLWGSFELILTDTELDHQKQYIYRRHNDYINPPALLQTQDDRDDDDHLPDDWTSSRIGATKMLRYVWRAERERFKSSGPWSLWKDIEINRHYQQPIGLLQECYYLAEEGAVGDLPTIPASSALAKADEANIPSGKYYYDDPQETTATRPNLWLLTRYYYELDPTLTTNWAYARVVDRYNAELNFRLEQRCFFLSAEGSVSDLPSLEDQNSAINKADEAHIPNGCVDIEPKPTALLPNVWLLRRYFRPTNPALTTDWAYVRIVATYSQLRELQRCYYLAADGSVGEVGQTLSLADQDEDDRSDKTFRPAGTALTYGVLVTTAAKPNIWELQRFWIPAESTATDWALVGIIRSYVDRPAKPANPAGVTVAPSDNRALVTLPALPSVYQFWDLKIIRPLDGNSLAGEAASIRERSYYFTGLDPLTTYQLIARKRNYQGTSSDETQTVNFRTTSGAPAAPTGVGNGSAGPESIRVYWNRVPGLLTEVEWDRDINYEPGGPAGAASWAAQGSLTSAGASLIITGLMPNSKYRYRVRHFNPRTGARGPTA